jgi:ABC-type branched-subunit amino acid transport system substrate-binding protein
LDLNAAPAKLTLGGLFPLTGTLSGGGVEREAAFRMAINEINSRSDILPNTVLDYKVRDTGTDPTTGATAAQELIDLGVFGLVGAASSSVSKAVAEKASVAEVPQISYSSTNPDLSDKATYPYFLRVVPSDAVQGSALANIVNELGFDTVATLATSDDYGLGGIGVFETAWEDLGNTVATGQRFAQGATDVTTQLQAIVDSGATTIVLNVIVGDAITVFSQAASVGITPADYTWIGTDGSTQEQVFSGDTAIQAAMQGMTGTAPNTGTGDLYVHFKDMWECASDTYFEGSGDRNPNTYATFSYDAVYAFANAADNMIKAGMDPTDGVKLLAELKDLTYSGATGQVRFDDHFDRSGIYDVLNLQDDTFETVGSWDKTDGLKQFSDIIWGDGTFVNGTGTGNPNAEPAGHTAACSDFTFNDNGGAVPTSKGTVDKSDSSSSPAFGIFLALMASFVTVFTVRNKKSI